MLRGIATVGFALALAACGDDASEVAGPTEDAATGGAFTGGSGGFPGGTGGTAATGGSGGIPSGGSGGVAGNIATGGSAGVATGGTGGITVTCVHNAPCS